MHGEALIQGGLIPLDWVGRIPVIVAGMAGLASSLFLFGLSEGSLTAMIITRLLGILLNLFMKFFAQLSFLAPPHLQPEDSQASSVRCTPSSANSQTRPHTRRHFPCTISWPHLALSLGNINPTWPRFIVVPDQWHADHYSEGIYPTRPDTLCSTTHS
jgi:hypothetical protein